MDKITYVVTWASGNGRAQAEFGNLVTALNAHDHHQEVEHKTIHFYENCEDNGYAWSNIINDPRWWYDIPNPN